MSKANNEVYQVQNPAIGSAILWRFVCGYKSVKSEPVPFPLLFLVLPIIFREELCDAICSTQQRNGLSKVAEKLFTEKKNDELYSINSAAINLRELTLSSFNIGVSAKLFKLEYTTALVYPITEISPSGIAASTKVLLDSSEKFGRLCGDLTLYEICEWLKVRF